MLKQCRGIQRITKTPPHLTAKGSDIDEAVIGLEQPHGHLRRMIVPLLLRFFTTHGVTGTLEIQLRHHGFKQGGVHPLAFSCALSVE